MSKTLQRLSNLPALRGEPARLEAGPATVASLALGAALSLPLLASGVAGWAVGAVACAPFLVSGFARRLACAARRHGAAWEVDEPAMVAAGAASGVLFGAVSGAALTVWAASESMAYSPLAGLVGGPAGLSALAVLLPSLLVGAAVGLGVSRGRRGRTPFLGAAYAAMVAGVFALGLLGLGVPHMLTAGLLVLAGTLPAAKWWAFSAALGGCAWLPGAWAGAWMAAAAAGAGSLVVGAADAHDARPKLAPAESFPAWARAESVTGFYGRRGVVHIDG